MKRYRYGEKLMTETEARAFSPNPMLFERATEAMTKKEIEGILSRNVAEIRFWLKQWDMVANGEINGRVTKRSLVNDANRLHDWRVSMTVMSSALGRAYLWEE